MNSKNNSNDQQQDVWKLLGNSLPEGWGTPVNTSKDANSKKRKKSICNSSGKSYTPPKQKVEEIIYVKLPTTVWIGTIPISVTEAHFSEEDFKIPMKKTDDIHTNQIPTDQDTDATSDEEINQNVDNESTDVSEDSAHVSQDDNTSLIKQTDDDEIDINAKYVDLETIRQFIEETLPAYTKERTKMYYDKIKNIVIPDLFNSKLGALSPFCGYFFSIDNALKSQLPKNICACSNGFFNLVNTSYAHMCVKAENLNELEYGYEGFMWSLPSKIPLAILSQLTSFFKHVARLDDTYESMGRIYYDSIKDDFFVIVPSQVTSCISVNLVNTYEKDLPKTTYRIMTCHSHPIYPAEFSNTDNNNDQETGLSLVMGWTANKEIPDFNLRMSVNGIFKKLEMSSVFNMPLDLTPRDFSVSFPEEWLRNITFRRREHNK